MSKEDELEIIKKKIVEAKILLHEGATNVVMGKGSPNAKVMMVGEAPGKNEDLQGMPFVGAAGKNLDKLLAAVGLSMNDVYVANILKYRPPENREPNQEEMTAHTPYLLEQISVIKPAIVCSLGNYATKFFLAGGNVEKMKEQQGITTLHGKVTEITINNHKMKIIPLFHPAAIIYNRKLITLWEEDMEIVKKEIENNSSNLT